MNRPKGKTARRAEKRVERLVSRGARGRHVEHAADKAARVAADFQRRLEVYLVWREAQEAEAAG